MKKILLIIIILVCMGCSNNEINNFKKVISDSIDNMYQRPIYKDDNPITVGLYQNGRLIHDYNTKFTNEKDITFNIVYSNDEYLGSTNIKKNWKKYYDKYKNIDDYKIGFLLEFEANGEKKENLILDPSTRHKSSPYIFVYLYDGIHQKDGAWYSHLNMEDIKKNTIYSSIKLYFCSRMDQVTSPIKLTVFTYDSDYDFDIKGYYRGNSKYTINIYNK